MRLSLKERVTRRHIITGPNIFAVRASRHWHSASRASRGTVLTGDDCSRSPIMEESAAKQQARAGRRFRMPWRHNCASCTRPKGTQYTKEACATQRRSVSGHRIVVESSDRSGRAHAEVAARREERMRATPPRFPASPPYLGPTGPLGPQKSIWTGFGAWERLVKSHTRPGTPDRASSPHMSPFFGQLTLSTHDCVVSGHTVPRARCRASVWSSLVSKSDRDR